MQFKALQPGRVTITLTVSVPKQVSGKSAWTTYTDSLHVEVYPAVGLTRPKQQPLWSVLMSTHAVTQLQTTRDTVNQGGIQYSVTPLTDDGVTPVSVTSKGSLQSCAVHGRAVVNLMISEDFGVKAHHSLVVEVNLLTLTRTV
jgi:hypothetical protein